MKPIKLYKENFATGILENRPDGDEYILKPSWRDRVLKADSVVGAHSSLTNSVLARVRVEGGDKRSRCHDRDCYSIWDCGRKFPCCQGDFQERFAVCEEAFEEVFKCDSRFLCLWLMQDSLSGLT